MQGFKKVLVALLVVMTILGTMGPVFAAPADVQGTKYEDAAVRLMALGIFKGDDKGNFNPDMPISRAEATAIIIRALGLEKSAELMKGVTKFADVNADPGLQWATGAINIAVSQGIIKGYPDGRFGGRDNVTYAQLAKMILYALNYGITVEGGVWPTAVLAKADDLGILDGLTVVADAPIVRGEAAKMLDNSLDVKSLKQVSYGASPEYREEGQTLLEKLGLDEIEGQIVEIPAVADRLEDNEVGVALSKVNGQAASGTETYTVLPGVDVESLFGYQTKLWVNKDDEVVFASKKTKDSEVYTDSVVSFTDNPGTADDVLKLKVLGTNTTVKVKSDATVWVNYEPGSLARNQWGRFVKTDNKVTFANVFNFNKVYGGVVTSVSEKEIKYFEKSATTRSLRLSQYDNVHVLGTNFEKLSLGDIHEDSVIYAFNKGTDDLYIVVVGKVVEGTLERVYADKVRIDGKEYKVEQTKNSSDNDVMEATVSTDDDKTVNIYTTSNAKDLVGEDVVALLGINGYVRHLRGATSKVSGWNYGVVTNAFYQGGDLLLKVFTQQGETVTYALEKESNWTAGTNFGSKDEYYPVAYKINSKGEIAKDKLVLIQGSEVTLDSDTYNVSTGNVDKAKKDQDYVVVDGKRFYVDSSTVIMKVFDGDDKDPQLLSWAEDFAGSTLSSSDNNVGIVVGTIGRGAKFILFTQKQFKTASADWYYGIATSAKWYEDDAMITLEVAGQGEVTYVLPNDDEAIGKGDVVKFRVSGNEAKSVKFADVNGTLPALNGTLGTDGVAVYAQVYAIASSGRYVKFDASGDWFKVASDAVIGLLDASDRSFDQLGDIGDIEVGKNAIYIVDDEDSKLIKAMVIW
jgi:hypothetical protein